MKKTLVLLTTLALAAACTEQELPVTAAPDTRVPIVPAATVTALQGIATPYLMPHNALLPGTNNPQAAHNPQAGTAFGQSPRATYPYTTTNASGQQTVIVYADDNGKSAETLHAPWLVTPVHDELSPMNSVSPRFEMGDQCTQANTGVSPSSNGEYLWSLASTLCDKYFKETNKSDLGKWRLPTLKEVVHLSPTNYFWLWSATQDSGNSNNMWVHKGSGSLSINKVEDCFVRCVRDAYPYLAPNAAGQKSVIVSQDRYGSTHEPLHAPWTVTPVHDELSPENALSTRFEVATALAHAYKDWKTWEEARTQCTGSWRLPTLEELKLIRILDSNLDTSKEKGLYWSAAEKNNESAKGWVVNFDAGKAEAVVNKTDRCNVRCVRDLTLPMPTPPDIGTPGAGQYSFIIQAFAGPSEPTNWTTAYFNTEVEATATGFKMREPRYYPVDGSQKLYFYATAPSCGGSSGGATTHPSVIHYFTSGLKDVMYAKDTRGIAKSSNPAQQQQPAFLFEHLLKQVQFKVKCDNTFETNRQLNKLYVVGVNTSVSIDIITGAVRAWGNQTDIAHTLPTPVELTTRDTHAATLMFQPGTEFTVVAEVSAKGNPAANVSTYTIPVKLTGGTNPGSAGTANVVTLTFKRKKVEVGSTLGTWNATVDMEVDVNE